MEIQFVEPPSLPPERAEKLRQILDDVRVAPPSEKLSAFGRAARRTAREIVGPTYSLREAVDRLQATAEAHGLVEEFGENTIQSELATAFEKPILNDELDARAIEENVRPAFQNHITKASELRSMKFDPVHYTVPGFIPHGVTILAAKPKAGKSWLMLDVCIAVAAGRLTLGQLKPSDGDVLYLALEDSKRRLQGRVDKLLTPFGAEWPARLEFATEWKKLHEGGLEDLAQWCGQHPNARLIVIDILERVRKPDPGGKQRPYALDYEAIATLQPLAHKYNLSVVVVTHLRKNESDDPFDTVSGTLGLTGAADTLLVLQKTTAGVTLHAVGRDIDGSSTAVQFDKSTCRWTILGAAAEVRLSDERRKILTALRESAEPLGPKAIAKAVGSKEGTVRVTLGRMVEDGEIQKVGRAMYIPVASVTSLHSV
jgi:AAA domain